MTFVIPGTGGHQGDARLSCGFGIALGHVAGALFMAGQNHFELLLLMQHVEYLQHDSARKSKNRLYALTLSGTR